MFGCQPTFSFQKLQEHSVYFSVVENNVSRFNITKAQLVWGREANRKLSKDLGSRQRERGTCSLGSALQQQSGRTGWKQNPQKEEKKRQKGHGGCLGCVSSPQKIGKGSFPYPERELGKMKVRWEKGLIGRQCAVRRAHFRSWGKKKAFKMCSGRCPKETLCQFSKLRQAVWTQVQQVGSR